MQDLANSARTEVPLVVDLDGSLVRIDTSLVLAGLAAKSSPLGLLSRLLNERGSLKSWLWAVAGEAFEGLLEALPWRSEVLAWLREERAKGRELILATGAPQGLAERVAENLQLFNRVMGSQPGLNLVGAAKAAALPKSFDYLGDSRQDLAVWAHAELAVGVALDSSVEAALPCALVRHFPGEPLNRMESLAFGWRGGPK